MNFGFFAATSLDLGFVLVDDTNDPVLKFDCKSSRESCTRTLEGETGNETGN